jgi:non-specific serine/threonine protein kinase/serine/threonine-protein kinase
MTPDQWREVDEVLVSALDLPENERSAYLDSACEDRPALRAEVDSLLAAHRQAGDFIEAAIADGAGFASSETPLIGRRIGSYKLVKELGRGGMGSVYRAERDDQQFSKDVAIKLIGTGISSASLLHRFQEEQQILATLEHPNIARLLDGGVTADGLHYIVMEYVEGVPIDEYCNRQSLNVDDRLKLFQSVCSAVHFAHQHLVVHRDIKPGNILVTAEGVPKLLDFGIAKFLDPAADSPQALATRTLAPAMTPDYASPEQLSGGIITTASDIYSLGVLLYELLAGTRPYRLSGKTLGEILQIVCELEPERPSIAVASSPPKPQSQESERAPTELRRRLAGDPDNIVLTALKKDPRRRYGSVEQFSEDIRRHLEGFPVIARKDTLGYRAGKFIQRHTATLIAAAVILVTLIAGLMGTLWQARIANAQRARAEQRFNDVRKLANSFMFDLEKEIQGLPGSTRAQEKLVKTALQYLDSLARESRDDPSLQRELAVAYQRVGDIEGRRGTQNLGNTSGALESYWKALRIREALAAAFPADSKARNDLAVMHTRIADLFEVRNDIVTALEHNYKALQLYEAASNANPRDRNALDDLATGYSGVGRHLLMQANWTGALKYDLKALSIEETLAASGPTDDRARYNLAIQYGQVAYELNKSGDRIRALEYCAKAQKIGEDLAAAHPHDVSAQLDLSSTYQKLADLQRDAGNVEKSLQSLHQALAISQAAAEADPHDTRAKISLASVLNSLGWLLIKAGKTQDVEYIRKGLEIREKLCAAEPANPRRKDTVGNSYVNLGEAEVMLALDPQLPSPRQIAHWREARSWYQRALEIYIDLRAKSALRGKDAGEPDRLAGEIAKCDAALSKARKPPGAVN